MSITNQVSCEVPALTHAVGNSPCGTSERYYNFLLQMHVDKYRLTQINVLT